MLSFDHNWSVSPFEIENADGVRRAKIDGPLSVNGTESLLDAVLLGLGLAQLPDFHIARDLTAGRAVRVPARHDVPPVPVSVLYQRNRQLSPRVRLFIDWTAQLFAAGKLDNEQTITE